MTKHVELQPLLDIMARLRDPENGCPWDIKQTYQSIVPFTIEEAYEVADAIERSDYDDLKGELGDLLFQVVFYAQIAQEEQRFEFQDIVDGICHKLTQRHPHVFSDQQFDNEGELHRAWELQKHKERQHKNQNASLMDDIPNSLPGIKRAQKLQKRAAKQGFDWPSVDGVWDKVDEEIAELKQALAADENSPEKNAAVMEEFGDLMFALVNLSRHLNLDAEQALRLANRKFEARFRSVEQAVKESGKTVADTSLEKLELFWQQAKQAE
ncbi:MAG: nucleoside triphosphate pyrophosphohydrolase [Gammaproteobacteria bacterium]|nr:nucleoside triphosphate pyrophosphohydrolase [Gammaproteobacteria bacterium]NVK88811.1 nucleoside triphosphate pyrophosphohydrolase [Gammaproteobacteria bacterium]